jgi:hypothetical protein
LIYGILEDESRTLWISTNKGLAHFDPETRICKSYTVSDGLQSNVFGSTAFCRSASGEMFFGGVNGLNAFHPDSIRDNQHIPPVVITDFQLFNKSVLPGKDSPLKKTILETKAINLSHEQNVVSFAFAALDFMNPAHNKYAYKMDGVDRDWVHTDASRRFVTYAQLDPGEYTFHVKASNNDGVWNEEGASIKVIITPPWWQTRWAYASYASLLITLVFGTIRFEVNRNEKPRPGCARSRNAENWRPPNIGPWWPNCKRRRLKHKKKLKKSKCAAESPSTCMMKSAAISAA